MLERAAVDIDTDRVWYHMEIVLKSPLPSGAILQAQYLCLSWPYGGLWKIEAVTDNNTRVKCVSWRKTELSREEVEQLAKDIDEVVETYHEIEENAKLDTMPTLFEWKLVDGEWGSDATHWFLRSIDPPAGVRAARQLIAYLFVEFDPLEARIDVNAVTSLDTVEQNYSADVTWYVTLPATTMIRDDAILSEFLHILDVNPDKFEFSNITSHQSEGELMASLIPAGEAEFSDVTLVGENWTVEQVYSLQYSRRVTATFTEEMADFPFDRQNLLFTFTTGVNGMANRALRLTPVPVEPGSFSIENYQLGNVFDVAYHNEVFVCDLQETGPKKSISFEMVLQRRGAYYVINVAVIAAIITYLCFITLAPADGDSKETKYMDTGSRLQVVTALVLTGVTVKNQVAELIPKVSYFTTLDKYIFSCFIVSSLVTLDNVVFYMANTWFTTQRWSEDGMLGFFFGAFTLVNVVWALYLVWQIRRRQFAASVLMQVHKYIRVITRSLPSTELTCCNATW